MSKSATCLATSLAIFAAGPAAAQAYLCSRPLEPYCISLGPFRDEFAFRACRDEVEWFRSQMREYADCLRMERDDAISLLNRTIDRFNECARNRICY
jgi:hypothetical protein